MGSSRIRLIAGVIAGTAVLLGVAAHFLLPAYLAGRVEERLEERGGRAEVKLRAVPALRLLAGHGDRIEITGSGLRYELEDPDEDAFERLDNFDAVKVDLREVSAGPFDTERFLLERSESGNRYAVEIEATASPRDLAEAAGQSIGGLGRLIGELAGGAIPFSGVSLPVSVEGVVESKDGRVELVEGGGDVAGIPAGPLTQLITNSVLSGL